MKKLLACLAFIVPALVLAQVAATGSPVIPVVPVVDPNLDFLQLLLKSLGGLKGAGLLASVGVVVQVLLKFLDLPLAEKLFGKAFSDWDAHIKLCVVTLLTLLGGVVTLMTQSGLSLVAALVHSSTLTMAMVFGNEVVQAYKAAVAPAVQAPKA
jgi:hypothetical protein